MSLDTLVVPLRVNHSFDLLNQKVNIEIPKYNVGLIKDIKLKIYASPSSVQGKPIFILKSVENLKISINDVNITNYVIDDIRRKLSIMPEKKLRNEYLIGVEHLSKLLDRYKNSIPRLATTTMLKEAEELLISGKIRALKKLGVKTFGLNGILHPINYIYSNIQIPAISIDAIIKNNPEIDSLYESENIEIKVTHEDSAIPKSTTAPIIAGKITIMLKVYYQNPVYNMIENINTKLRTITNMIDLQRTEYLEGLNSEIHDVNDNLTIMLDSNKEALENLLKSMKK